MVSGMTVRVFGLEKALLKLRNLEGAVAMDRLEEAALAGAEVIREEMSIRAPRRTGKLAGEIVKLTKSKSAAHTEVAIGPSKDAWYGKFQELGTVHHAAQPFMRPASDAKRGDARRAAKNSLRSSIGR